LTIKYLRRVVSVIYYPIQLSKTSISADQKHPR
jgi:hypothetical protein